MNFGLILRQFCAGHQSGRSAGRTGVVIGTQPAVMGQRQQSDSTRARTRPIGSRLRPDRRAGRVCVVLVSLLARLGEKKPAATRWRVICCARSKRTFRASARLNWWWPGKPAERFQCQRREHFRAPTALASREAGQKFAAPKQPRTLDSQRALSYRLSLLKADRPPF